VPPAPFVDGLPAGLVAVVVGAGVVTVLVVVLLGAVTVVVGAVTVVFCVTVGVVTVVVGATVVVWPTLRD
jgi:hypothetical protein